MHTFPKKGILYPQDTQHSMTILECLCLTLQDNQYKSNSDERIDLDIFRMHTLCSSRCLNIYDPRHNIHQELVLRSWQNHNSRNLLKNTQT